MATLEKSRLTLRVAYAGPPLAGKTESIRMLLRLLRGKDGDKHVFSPGEARGRTILFDWADYEAGTFEGKPIRCQITSVPGQAVLSARREALVKAADAVVLVVDSRPEGLEDARRCYAEMSPWLAEAGRELEVRVVLQCNKQDLEGSFPPDLLRSRLGLAADRPSYGTSATTGKGLRPAFIAAVREAMNRARTLTDRGLIRIGRPEIDSGQELLERLQRDVVAAEASIDPRVAPPLAEVAPEPPRAWTVVAAPAQPASKAQPPAPDVPAAIASAPPPQASAVAPSPVPPRVASAPPEVSRKAAEAPTMPPRRRDAEAPTVAAQRTEAEQAASRPVRPAVMPASAWRAQSVSVAPNAIQPATPAAQAVAAAPLAAPVDESARTAALQAAAPVEPTTRTPSPTAPSRPERPLLTEPKAHAGPPLPPAPGKPPRPAVMPASAYRATNGVHTHELPAAARATPVGLPPPIAAAVVPSEGSLAAPVTEARDVETADSPAAMTERVPQPPSRLQTRPAVMPAAAFRAQFGGAAAVPAASPPADPTPSVEPWSDAPRLPARGLPDERVCPVAIWRPLEQQMAPNARAAADPRGGWHGEPVPGWYAHTIDSEADLAAARRLYDTVVSRHSALHRYLSKDRCLALTEDAGRWWVWQVVRKVPTLSTRFNDWPRAGDPPEASAESLLDCAASYWMALQAIRQAPEALPVAFEKVAPQDGAFVYAGLLPRGVAPAATSLEDDGDFEDVLRKKLALRPPPPAHVPAVLEELRKKARGRLPGPILEMICSVLIGH